MSGEERSLLLPYRQRFDAENKIENVERPDAAQDDLAHRQAVEAMGQLRAVADELETMVGKDYWPFPTYSDLLFRI